MFRNRAACLLAVLLWSVVPAAAQSFDCAKASKPDEVLICQNRQLSALDEQMSSLYFRLRNRLAAAARNRIEADQSAWLQQRYGCGSDVGCIKDLYDRRISQLANY